MKFHLCAWLLTIIYWIYGEDDCDDFYVASNGSDWLFLEIEDKII